MQIFVCYRSTDKCEGDALIAQIRLEANHTCLLLQETQHADNWKDLVADKLQTVDFVLFLLGEDTLNSKQIQWEYETAKSLNKRIVALRLKNYAPKCDVLPFDDYIFDTVAQLLAYMNSAFVEDKALKVEQYKMMVRATENVTDQRMKVNNLFFTITSSILSVAFVLGKTYNFTLISVIAMFVLTLLALLTARSWETLVQSYGKLNTGKFKIINRLEKDLNTNMFEEEWQILTKQIQYQPNTQTEKNIIFWFKIFIVAVLVVELAYVFWFLWA
jgi:hypothetical protein